LLTEQHPVRKVGRRVVVRQMRDFLVGKTAMNLMLIEGATENAAAPQALLDNLLERRLDPKTPRLFILDGAKAPSKAVRATSVAKR
jgi:hypothetical protein